MNLDSISFLLFLPLAFAIYWAIPTSCNKARNCVLIVLSYIFYGCADWRFCLLLLAVSLLTYAASSVMYRWHGGRHAKSITIAHVTMCVVVLGVFKYFGFFAEQVIAICGGADSLLVDNLLCRLIVPLGMSFYLFMAMSYVIDRYRKVLDYNPCLLDFMSYISFFPHLLAGPIDRGREMIPQFQKPRIFSYDKATDGLRQIICGLFKKVVIADNAAIIVNHVWNDYSHSNSVVLILSAVLYSIQIYADFSGYSDMAIGTGRLFGLEMRRNFAYPYFARNASEFWRGWHMSLTSWFTEYLYIPLGGSRKGKTRTLLNTLIVFTLCGLWHGANWTFVVWGFLCGALFIPLLLSERSKSYWKGKSVQLDARNLVSILVTFLSITACWIFFRAPSLGEALGYISSIGANLHEPLALKACFGNIFMKPLWALLLLLFVIVEWRGRNDTFPLASLRYKPMLVRWCSYLLLVLLIMCYNTVSGNFIYQNF